MSNASDIIIGIRASGFGIILVHFVLFVYFVCFVSLVYLVYLVCLVYSVGGESLFRLFGLFRLFRQGEKVCSVMLRGGREEAAECLGEKSHNEYI